MKIHINKFAIALPLLTGIFLASCSGDNHEGEVKKDQLLST